MYDKVKNSEKTKKGEIEVKTQMETSEEIVRRYAIALNTLTIEPLVFSLHPIFKYIFPLGGVTGINGGLSNELRCLGYWAKTFKSMKLAGEVIRAELCSVNFEGVKFQSIILHPLHDKRILFPLENRYADRVQHKYLPAGEVLLHCKVKQDLLFRVVCIPLSGKNADIISTGEFPV